jgi:hypothetical protein
VGAKLIAAYFFDRDFCQLATPLFLIALLTAAREMTGAR